MTAPDQPGEHVVVCTAVRLRRCEGQGPRHSGSEERIASGVDSSSLPAGLLLQRLACAQTRLSLAVRRGTNHSRFIAAKRARS
jgi:hypothetical protein